MALAVQGRTGPERPRDTAGLQAPRFHLFDDLFEKRYDESILDDTPCRPIGRALPAWARLAREVSHRRDEYDVVVTWSERVSLALMTVDRFSRGGKPHVAMLYWFSRPSVRTPLRAFGDRLQAIVTWSSVQRTYAIERLRIAPEKLYLVKHFVDQVFWSSDSRKREANTIEREADTICSAGAEMRDYPTLLEALRGTDVRCHIATDHVRVDDRWGFGRRVSAEAFAAAASRNVTVGRLPFTELRDLYANSRFVVVPLHRTDTDNGVNVILEAMAMGKPVICSRTEGQVDVIQEGVTGLFVPVGNASALRAAIVSLWNDPERTSAMGRAARAYVEQHHTLDKFCRDVKGAIDASLDGHSASMDGSVRNPP
jgi:glycosyltransferase involved in cell wall biosynthesis